MKDGKIPVGQFVYEDGLFWWGSVFVWDGCDEGIRTSESQYEGYSDKEEETVWDIINFK